MAPSNSIDLEIFGPSLRELGIEPLQWGNYHPPFNALLFLPITFLDYPRAFILWSFISLLLYVALILVLLQTYGLLSFRWLRLSSVLLLWEPVTSNIFLGQLSIALSCGIIGSFFYCGASRTAWLASVWAWRP